MPPKRGKAKAATLPAPSALRASASLSPPPPLLQAASLSTASPTASSGTTLVQALEHIPAQAEGIAIGAPRPLATAATAVKEMEDDDLTPPPPSLEDIKPTEVAEPPSTGKRKRTKKAATYVESPDEAESGEVEVKPKKTRKTPTKEKAAVDDADADFEGEQQAEEEGTETPKKAKTKAPRKPTPKKSRLAKDEPEYDSEGNEIVKKKRKPKVYPKIEYEIPDVEKKQTTFRGRLGYACLNTVLRSTKPDSIFCSRTCRIASIEEEGMELPKGLALLNVRDLKTMIEWNEQNKIRFMRLSSEMFPFASHAKYGYDLSFAAEGLKEAGDLAKKYGHRLTMHPGQFTQLGSPKDGVVTASVRELEYQCEILDRMGIDQDGVMIIHMGGIYGDKPSTLERFKENYKKLPDKIKGRLVLENDEICYNVDDLLPVCNELGIPIIFDYHHDWINPSAEPPSVLIPKIAEMWKKRGIKMKQHLSEPRPGAESVMEKRAHANRCQNLPPDLPDDVDLMIEAKDKEQAVFELYRMYGLEDVIHDNLRPPEKNPGLRTNGRKSSLKKKTKETGLTDSEGEDIELSDVEKEGDGGVGDEGTLTGRVETSTPKKGKGRGKKVAKVEDGVVHEMAPSMGDVKEEGTVEVKKEEAPKKRGKKRKSEVSQVSEQVAAEISEEVKLEQLDALETEEPKKKGRGRAKKVAA